MVITSYVSEFQLNSSYEGLPLLNSTELDSLQVAIKSAIDGVVCSALGKNDSCAVDAQPAGQQCAEQVPTGVRTGPPPPGGWFLIPLMSNSP